VRREQDRPAPRRRRACRADFWYFITTRPTRSAYAPHALFWRCGSTRRCTHAFLRRSLRDRSCIPSPVQARQPRIAGAVDAPLKKLMTPKAPKQHGRRESAAGSTPHRSEYRQSSGAFCTGEEGLPGDGYTIAYHPPPFFITVLTLPRKIIFCTPPLSWWLFRFLP
jgi:hypothetical protein